MADINTGPGQGVLTLQDLNQINRGIEQADEAIRQAELAKRAGVDIGPIEQQAIDARARLISLKQVYFPGQ